MTGAFEARKKRVKTLFCSALGMPIPLSVIAMCTAPSIDLSSTVTTPPSFVYCTAFSILKEPIPAIHYLIPLMGNLIPVAPYATYGTKAMGPAALKAMRKSRAALLPYHGLMAGGATLDQAMNLSRIAEYIAQSYYLARTLGKIRPLPLKELDNLRDQFSRYGQVKKAKPMRR